MTARFFSWATYLTAVSIHWKRSKGFKTHLTKEPRNKVAKDNGLVGLRIARRRRNASSRPQIALPLVEPPVARAGVEEEHTRCAVNEPSSVEHLDAAVAHRLDGGYESRVFGLNGLHLDRGLVVVVSIGTSFDCRFFLPMPCSTAQ